MTGRLIKIKLIIKCSPCQNTTVCKHFSLPFTVGTYNARILATDKTRHVCKSVPCSCPPSAPISLKTQQHMNKPLKTHSEIPVQKLLCINVDVFLKTLWIPTFTHFTLIPGHTNFFTSNTALQSPHVMGQPISTSSPSVCSVGIKMYDIWTWGDQLFVIQTTVYITKCFRMFQASFWQPLTWLCFDSHDSCICFSGRFISEREHLAFFYIFFSVAQRILSIHCPSPHCIYFRSSTLYPTVNET